jgi:hypothetical protein
MMDESFGSESRADALSRRRRSFVAAPAERPAFAPPPPAVSEDDDLPVLTEVVSAEAAVSEDRDDRFDETQVTLLASDIAHAFGRQLTDELPSLLEAALVNAGEELRAGISAAMETALRDFIARRKQLKLPLDEPGI